VFSLHVDRAEASHDKLDPTSTMAAIHCSCRSEYLFTSKFHVSQNKGRLHEAGRKLLLREHGVEVKLNAEDRHALGRQLSNEQANPNAYHPFFGQTHVSATIRT